MFNRVCIVGIGLIGGSFGLALKKHGLAREIIGVARSEASLAEAVEFGACDWATANLVEAATGADLVFLAPPVGQMRALCAQIAPLVAPGALVTDAGSTKAHIVAECEPLFAGRAHFIGGHPMAGSEKTGAAAARDDLFDGATWVLTPTSRTDSLALETLENLVKTLGARPLTLDSQAHDEMLAVTSHLPHLVAAALVHRLGALQNQNSAALQLIAGGFRDGTRVAAGSPEMWRDICLANSGAIWLAIDDLIGELGELQMILGSPTANESGPVLLDWLEKAAVERRKF